MLHRFDPRSLLPLGALSIAVMLGGCVVYPAYPSYPTYSSYPAYGYGAPYYGGVYVGGGWRR